MGVKTKDDRKITRQKNEPTHRSRSDAASLGIFLSGEGDIRYRTLKRFPYAVYYRILDDELRILVVKHHKRHPDYWRYRLRDELEP